MSENNQRNTRQYKRSWFVAAAVAIPIFLLAGMFSWYGNDDAVTSESPDVAQRPAAGQVEPDQSGQFAIPQASMGDFDSGRQVPSHSGQADFWYQARTGSDRFFSAREGAQLAIIGRTDSPTKGDVESALQQEVAQEINLNQMSPGLWIAVRTSEGNLAAFTIDSHAGISPGTLRLDYMLWQGE